MLKAYGDPNNNDALTIALNSFALQPCCNPHQNGATQTVPFVTVRAMTITG
jgi:hypothetical protein